MNGRKAKAIRMLAKYSVTEGRPALPEGGLHGKTVKLPKSHARAKYQFLKDRYGMVPLAGKLKRMHNSRAVVEAIDEKL
jgi:hypothetical protein